MRRLSRRLRRTQRQHACLMPCLALVSLWAFFRVIEPLYKLARVTTLLPIVDLGPDMFAAIERTARVPAIIHHLSETEDIPSEWSISYLSTKGVHNRFVNEYTYELWTDERIEVFIAKEFPLFYPKFKRYEYNIERVDAARYFILLKYGGIYIDLDVGCRRSLDNLRRTEHSSVILPITSPLGLSNDFMMAAPNHPFMQYLTQRLQDSSHDSHALLPWNRVMWTTGPLFLSSCLYDWLSSGLNLSQDVALLRNSDYTKKLLYHLPGSSWLGRDGRILIYVWWTVLPLLWRVVEYLTALLLVVVCSLGVTRFVQASASRAIEESSSSPSLDEHYL